MGELAMLHSIDEKQPALREVKWVWDCARLEKRNKMFLEDLNGLKAALTNEVRSRFTGLDQKGMLTFVDEVTEI